MSSGVKNWDGPKPKFVPTVEATWRLPDETVIVVIGYEREHLAVAATTAGSQIVETGTCDECMLEARIFGNERLHRYYAGRWPADPPMIDDFMKQ